MYTYELYEKLSEKYPKSLSCPWDNDGIMVTPGNISEVLRVLIALDATEDTLIYAAENSFDVVITHHPMIFSGMKSVTPENNTGRKVIFALMNSITVMSFHTRLDAAPGGVNDALAGAISLSDVRPFGDDEAPTIGRIGKTSAGSVRSFFSLVKENVSPKAECYSADGDEKCETVAVLGGAGKDFISVAAKLGADVYLTGEASYNALLDAAENGLSVITCGHYETEVLVLSMIEEAVKSVSSDIYTEKYFPTDLRLD